WWAAGRRLSGVETRAGKLPRPRPRPGPGVLRRRHAAADLDRTLRLAGAVLRRRGVRLAVPGGRVVRPAHQARADTAELGVRRRLVRAVRPHGDRGLARLETPRLRRRALGARRVPGPARAQRGLVLALLRHPPHRPRPARDPAALGRDRHHRDPLLAPPRPRRRAAPALPPVGLVRDLPELRDLAA